MPDWAGRPSGDDVARFYPERAQRLEMEGRVVLLCNVEIDGYLSGCQVTQETPLDLGFGEAALNLSRLFRLKPMTRDGQPVAGGSIRIPLAFRTPSDPPPPPVDFVTPLNFDEAVMCHTLYKRLNGHFGGLPEDRRIQADARALSITLGAARRLSKRDVEKRLRQDIKDGLYEWLAIRRCEMLR